MQHTEIKLNSKEIFKGNVFRVTMDWKRTKTRLKQPSVSWKKSAA